MIIVKLNGGLGNQMFQYAMARKLALKFSTEVVLDTTVFENYKLRKYSLAPFNFVKLIAANKELTLFGVKQETNILKRYYYKIARRIFQPVFIREKQFNFDPDVLKNAKKNTYLDGYWQTEKYFADIQEDLLKDFSINTPMEDENLIIADKIKDANAVSLHVRRGDYVSNSETLKYHGLCGLDYYNKAIDRISKEIKNPVFFVFSDDMLWAKENLKTSFKFFFVQVNTADTSHEDLRLMSLCKHNIIANSSFSWWGAWLNTNESKIVIAPRRWFAGTEKNYSDVIPEKWIKL